MAPAMMKKTTLMGLLAVGTTIAYLWLKKQEDGDTLEGVEVTVNPQKLVDGALAMSNMGPAAKASIRNITERALSRYYEHEN